MMKTPRIVEGILKTLCQYFEKFRNDVNLIILRDEVSEDGNDDKVLVSYVFYY